MTWDWDGTPVVIPPKFGTANIVLSAAATATVAVTFPTAFTSTPEVFAMAKNRPADYLVTTPAAATTTGFILQARHIDGAANTLTVTVSWYAVA
jgi:hypothetical protein